MALLVAFVAVSLQCSVSALLSAALLGYAAGAAWFLPALLRSLQIPKETSTANLSITSGDDRSATLRMVHTLVDALLATAIVVVWQRLYGAQETGWMAATLRVMGFVPAVVNVAWMQVILAQPQHTRTNTKWIGPFGFIGVATLAACCALALEMEWLGKQWQGLCPYLLPLVIWQGSACMVAAFSQSPFETNRSQNYSWICIGIASLQAIVLISPVVVNLSLSPSYHFTWFASVSGVCFCAFWMWLKDLK
jgi:hypothetical protein